MMDDKLLTLADLSSFIGAPVGTMHHLVKDPTFPQPIRLPNGRGGFLHPRWKASQIAEWIDGYQPACTKSVPNSR